MSLLISETVLTCEPRSKNYGFCLTCFKQNKINWCKECEISAFKKNFNRWTSGNKLIDFVIQETQKNASESTDFLEWISFEELDLIEFCGKGTFSTVYSGYWLEGPRWIWDDEGDEWSKNGPIKIAIKRIDYSQNITKEYADKILKYRIQSGSFADCFGMTRDNTGCYAFIMKYYEHNLYQYLDEAKGILCWRDIVDMLWGISEGLEKIHKEGFSHGNLHGGNLLIENEPESVDVRIADIGIHGSILCNWVTAICDDPDPSEISNQFDLAEEKKFADLENNKFIIPPNHSQAKYTSQPLNF
ncbi:9348_t:CDS:2 [Diversispora eburnea]|uniref:9348_t:CDS:1 n=1 Tax=Diversispora eburnea TaxID=1213867 RepID=A0A9N8V466_9GLOM|nr:9348_t:CDS:2 [Diversispora eburnea]